MEKDAGGHILADPRYPVRDRLSFVIRLPRHPLSLGPVITGWEVTGEVERALRVMSGEMFRQQIQLALGLKGDDHFRTAYLISGTEQN